MSSKEQNAVIPCRFVHLKKKKNLIRYKCYYLVGIKRQNMTTTFI